MVDKQRVKVGVVGLGSFAHVARLPVLSGFSHVQMTACMARTPRTVEQVTRRFGFLRGFTDFNEFLRDSGIDAAVVATPKQTHYDIVIPLLERGVHVFCEKPMAMSLAQAEDMVRCAEKNSRVLMIGFNRRYAPVYEWARQEFSSSRPDVCVAFKNRPGTEFRATLENAIHMVDLMRFFCGECVEMTAYAQYADRDYEDSTAALMKFDSGSVGFLLGNRTCGQWMERFELYGSGKTITVNCPDDVTVVDHEQEHTRKLTPLHSGWSTLEEKMGFRQEMTAFLDAVENGTTPRTLASDSIKTHILLNRVLQEAGLPEMEA